ncbi:D-TA family PLP-dependent enzyme [Mucilaginibacter gynuensis]|uniref:D-TA family PLP-dependent enzyme n=1 Tax=Mucilaginibacter gynuensis TaxID=1302236 RepID=A0ABP8HF79_9SPHI
MATAQNWFEIADIDKLDTPALVLYPERVKHNLALLTGMIDNVSRLRPHIKSHKNGEVLKLNMAAGISKFKCATIAEAELGGICKVPDVLLAYQPTGPKLQRFINLIKNYPNTRYSCLVDNIDTAKAIAASAAENSITIPVYIDLNVGMNRTGIIPGDGTLQLYAEVDQLATLILIGLHAYDGHIHDADIEARKARCAEAFDPVRELLQQLKAKGYSPKVIAGGTPTFPIHALWEDVECSPGTFIYWDANYEALFEEQPFLPAALLVSRIVSLPADGVICTDLGHKSVASESELSKRVMFLNAPELKSISHSEEHLVLQVAENHDYKVGDVLYGLPFHVCPSVALYERVVIIDKNYIAGEWHNTARDRKINY